MKAMSVNAGAVATAVSPGLALLFAGIPMVEVLPERRYTATTAR